MWTVRTSLNVSSFFPDHVGVLCKRDVDLERDSLGLGIQVCQDQLPGPLNTGWQSNHLDLGVWEWGNGGMNHKSHRCIHNSRNLGMTSSRLIPRPYISRRTRNEATCTVHIHNSRNLGMTSSRLIPRPYISGRTI